MRATRMLAVLVCLLCLASAARADARANARTLRVASLMYTPVKWDKDANLRALDRRIRQAAAAGAELVVTPEGALDGYVVNEVIYTSGEKKLRLARRFDRLAEPITGKYVAHFQKLSRELRIWLVFCFLEARDGKTCNTAILIGPGGKIAGAYHKTHFAQGYSTGVKYKDNPVGYTRGAQYPVFQMDDLRLGVMICYDRRVPAVARRLADAGAELIVNPSYGVRGDFNRRQISARASENHLPVVFVHPRQTVVSDASGHITADLRPARDAQTVLDIAVPRRVRPRGSGNAR